MWEDEEKVVEEQPVEKETEEELIKEVNDGKIEFPVSGALIIGGIALIMIGIIIFLLIY